MPNTKSQMEPKTERTPGPWEDRGYIQNGRRIIASVKTGYNICEVYVGESEDAESDPIRSNAAFIVTACNHHDELMEALKNIRSYITASCPDAYGVKTVIGKLDALLAKIEGA